MDRRRTVRVGLAFVAAGAVILATAGRAPADPQTDKARVDRELTQAQSVYESASTRAQSALAAYNETTQRLTVAQGSLADANGVVAARKVESTRVDQAQTQVSSMVAFAARKAADEAAGRARQALSAAQAAAAAARQAADEVAALQAAQAAATAAANAQRDATLAQYQDLQAQSDALAAELRRLADKQRTPVAAPSHGAFFLTPVHGWKSSDFGMRYDPYYHVWQLHAGVDLAAPSGTPIYAAADGQVVRAGWNGGNGNYTCISHGLYQGQILSTCYAHQSAILVSVGQSVQRGQLIGRVGTTGASTGDHLHFEVRLNGTPVQPLNWLDACLC